MTATWCQLTEPLGSANPCAWDGRPPSAMGRHTLIPPAASAGWTNANGLLPSQHWLKQQHPGPSLNQMQRINYENLSQEPLLSSGVGCPLLPAEGVHSPLVGGVPGR